MTPNTLMNYQPIALEGKVLIDKAVFDELRANYARAQVIANIQESERQIRVAVICADEREEHENAR